MGGGGGPRKPTNAEKGPDPSKQTFDGQVVTQGINNGYIQCDDTMAVYGKDVYMWKTYFSQVGLGDYVRFQIHISDKGLPQVCWIEKVAPGVPPGPQQIKRPAA